MPLNALEVPSQDPTAIFELFRGFYNSELLIAGVAHFDVFDKLQGQSMSFKELGESIGLERRPLIVLTTALRSFGLLDKDSKGRFCLTELSKSHLNKDAYFDVSSYIGLAADSPGVVDMVECLRTNTPLGLGDDEGGAAFIYKDNMESAMENEASARFLTLALAGRAKNVAPVLAQKLDLQNIDTILDVGAGTGIYSIALLQKFPHLKAVIFDRPEVLKIAAEFAADYGVAERLELVAGDMFKDEYPQCDAVLFSNILHDWDDPENQILVNRGAASLKPEGKFFIHDVFLNDELDGPQHIAAYSAALFQLTEGRAYSKAEYKKYIEIAGLNFEKVEDTLIHCGVLSAIKA
jgi:predicted O-methyltransferase YrrM